MASNVSDRYPPRGRNDRRDSGYRSPSESSSSFDSRTGSYYYDDHASQRTAPGEEPKSKTETLTKFALGAAIVYGVLRIWNGEKKKEEAREKRRRREKRKDFERRKAARRREEERREREMEREMESEDEQTEVTERKQIGYAPCRSRSRRARSRAPDESEQSRPERSRSRGPPKIDGPPAPPTMTRASNVEGHGYEEYRSKSRTR